MCIATQWDPHSRPKLSPTYSRRLASSKAGRAEWLERRPVSSRGLFGLAGFQSRGGGTQQGEKTLRGSAVEKRGPRAATGAEPSEGISAWRRTIAEQRAAKGSRLSGDVATSHRVTDLRFAVPAAWTVHLETARLVPEGRGG